MKLAVRLGLAAMLLLTPAALAGVHETRIPLRDHKLQTADLTAALMQKLHLPGMAFDIGPVRSVDLAGMQGSDFVTAFNKSMGDGANVELRADELILRIDPNKLPRNFDSIRAAARVFTAVAAPNATAHQRRMYGLFMPKRVDAQKPMVVLVHGLDCNRSSWTPMADLLIGQGFQVAFFSYPSDQPLEDSAEQLAQNMAGLRETFPDIPLDIVAHSMGGLVARRYVEGEAYAGGVRHLVLLGTPNLGTSWAAYRMVLEVQEHYSLWRHEPSWRPSWMITDGLGEAGRDLKPTSRFLRQLNERPRREGVKYTVIAGAQHPIAPMTANAIEATANVIPDRAAMWWGFRHTDQAMRRAAERLRRRTGKSDGPVRVSSTQLPGVADHVIVSCDHASLYYPCEGKEPAAWGVIRDRLLR